MNLPEQKVLHLVLTHCNTDNGLNSQHVPVNNTQFDLDDAVIKIGNMPEMILVRNVVLTFTANYGLSNIQYKLYNSNTYITIATYDPIGRFEVCGIINEDSAHTLDDDDYNDYFNQEDEDNTMDISSCYLLLTTLIEEKNIVFKYCHGRIIDGNYSGRYDCYNGFGQGTNYVNALILTGEFITNQSVMNPVVRLQLPVDYAEDELSQVNVSTMYNYAYVSMFDRFYFINDVVFNEDGLVDIQLNEDALFSFCNDIVKQKGFISRNENTSNATLVDNRLPLEDKRTISVVGAGNYRVTNNSVNISFSVASFDYDTHYNYIITCVSDNYPTDDVPTPTNTLLQTIAPYSTGTASYIAFLKDVIKVQNAMRKDDTKTGFLVSMVVYPFDVSSVVSYSPPQIPLSFSTMPAYYIKSDLTFTTNSAESDINQYIINSGSFYYLILEDFNYNPTETFLDREPQAEYELFIPFVGWVKISSAELLNKRLVVYYGCDMVTGFATAYVYNLSDYHIVHSSPCQLGVKIPVSTTNALELEREKQNNVANLTLGLISSGLSLGVGVATSNPLGVIGGTLSVANTIKSYINTNNMMFERGQATFTSTDTAFYNNSLIVQIRISKCNPISIDSSTYAHTNGYPINQYGALSSYTGYTEIPDLHFIPQVKPINSDEINEIITLARDGIIL